MGKGLRFRVHPPHPAPFSSPSLPLPAPSPAPPSPCSIPLSPPTRTRFVRLLDSLTHTLELIPFPPSSQEYIAFERSNPQRVDSLTLTARISLAYDQFLIGFQAYPEVGEGGSRGRRKREESRGRAGGRRGGRKREESRGRAGGRRGGRKREKERRERAEGRARQPPPLHS